MKKISLIIICILLLGGAFWFFTLRNKTVNPLVSPEIGVKEETQTLPQIGSGPRRTNSSTTTETNSTDGILPPIPREKFLLESGLPTSTKLSLPTGTGNVVIRNPYWIYTHKDEDYLILSITNDYRIAYDGLDASIELGILKEPVSENRAKAEEAMLRLLEITPAEACKLKVRVIDFTQAFQAPDTKLDICGT